MKIWLEALTGKQAMLCHHLAELFEEEGHEILITSRLYDVTNGNFDRYGRAYVSIGKYGGASLKDKLVSGSSRIIELADHVSEFEPDVLIAFPSPDAFRTAFGLRIPSVQINDTPHAVAVGRLTISLADGLVHGSSVSSEAFAKMGVTTFYPYEGVDEVLWINNFSPSRDVLNQLGLKEEKYMVIRCEESKAAYFQKMYPSVKPGSTIVTKIISKLNDEGIDLKIVAFPRYPEQDEELRKLDVIIPDKSVDTLSLLYYAKVAMTAGGTMGREAALLGTPTIYSFPLELDVSTYVIKKGFPLHHCPDHLRVPQHIINLLGHEKMEESKRIELLENMETPYDGVLRALKDLELI